MVRGSAFGSDFNSKLAFALVTVGLVVWDRYRSKRWDYAWVLLVGAVGLALVEMWMQLRGTRSLPDRVLLGEHLPLVVSALLQGISEGAFIAVFGLFFADRILCRRSRNRALTGLVLALFLLVLLVVLHAARSEVAGQAAGRRDMTAVGPLVLLILVVAFDVWFWWRRPKYRTRSLMMTAVMLGLVAVWTTASAATGGRWVEVPGPTSDSFQRASSAVSISALTFDIVFEIVLAAVPFFAIPALLESTANRVVSGCIEQAGCQARRVTSKQEGGAGDAGHVDTERALSAVSEPTARRLSHRQPGQTRTEVRNPAPV